MPELLVRGSLLHFLDDPGPDPVPRSGSTAWHDDGAVLIAAGRVVAAGDWTHLLATLGPGRLAAARLLDHRGRLIVPGLVDTHLHYPQFAVMASWGEALLDWLERYTFPAEARFADPGVARETAAFVAGRLLAHGTTTTAVFPTVHRHSAEAWFEVAQALRLRTLCGKVLMDRHCPPVLCEDAAAGTAADRALIERWHGSGRLRYCLTPRFAATSTPAQLRATGALFASLPDLHLQSHLAENSAELAWIRTLFPEAPHYTQVYEDHGLLGARAIYAHCIHLGAGERALLARRHTAAAFCPSSNLFLGSGFFDLEASLAAGMRVGLGSDVGAGTSPSLLRTMADAYRVGQARGRALAPLRAWYLATLGGARALGLEAFVGNLEPGREADFVVLDWTATPELAWRMRQASDPQERLFALMMLGDERCVAATHVLGEAAYTRAG